MRDTQADLLRSFAIIGVVLIHTKELPAPSILVSSIALYFRWAVPIFIFLFAYYFKSTDFKKGTSKLISLAIPYIIYSTIYLLITNEGNLTFSGLVTKHMAGYGWSGQYFFIILFQLVYIIPYLNRFHVSHINMILVILFSILLYWLAIFYGKNYIIITKLSDRPFLYWIPYVFLGIYLRQNRALLNSLKEKNKYILLLLLTASPLLIVFSNNIIPQFTGYVNFPVLISSLLICVLYGSALKDTNSNTLTFIGKKTLSIFCLNPLCIIIIKYYFGTVFHGVPVLVYISSATIILLACLMISEILIKLRLKKLVG